ncbi:hypothetical protein CASFOL_039376 [Castilleja foliolosa]|uniref:Uncharacterized protein n=1 Tax=Castilleja foliolosa TaxID=1961234 RepID=A0ABD3BJP8_9LAMI
MGPTITKWISLIIVSFSLESQIFTQAQQVPCMFLYGDSQFDTGNNNMLITLAKANYPPYGIDYPDGSTGRSSNGKVLPDFLAELVGFASPISLFVTANGSDILRGVNYASGAAGILDESGVLSGGRFTMTRQLTNHQSTIDRIRVLLGNNQTTVNNYLNKCLYLFNVGSNDYLNNYYLSQLSLSRLLYTPDRFAQILIQRFNQQLRTLYTYGARKVAIFGVGLLGCVPQAVANFPTNGSTCVDFINNSVQLFTNRLPTLIDNLNRDLPAAQFTFINISNIALGDPSLNGLKVINASCCPVQRTTGLCVPNEVPCSNRSDYLFWDNFHPTEISYRALASRSYTSLLPADTYPVDIQGLIRQ